MIGKTMEEIAVGDMDEITKTVSETDVYLYAGITGDFNPAHLNEEYARQSFFKERIAHGMLTAGLISAVIGVKLPGPGTIYLKQQLTFLAPVHFNDTITAQVRVIEKIVDKNRVRLETICTNQSGKQVLVGEAVVIPPKSN